jgi:hypothetical protein
MSQWDDLQQEIAKDIREHPMDGYKPAFLGAMKAWGKHMSLFVFWIKHVTGTGGESEAHYWPNHCETCKEIAKFVEDWQTAGESHEQRQI